MRYLYFLVYSCLVLGLFTSFLYLMTVVDPGLLQLHEKAARMMKTNREGIQESPGELDLPGLRRIQLRSRDPGKAWWRTLWFYSPSEMYIDFTELLNKSRTLV